MDTSGIQLLFNFLLSLVVTIVQVVTYPINTLITASFPDLASQMSAMASTLHDMLAFLPWAFHSLFPPAVHTLLIFILVAELALIYVFQSSFYVAKIWKIVQRIKFW